MLRTHTLSYRLYSSELFKMKLTAIIIIAGCSIAMSHVAWGQEDIVKRGLAKASPFGTVIGYETRYGGMPYAGLWYFRPITDAEWEVRWYRVQATYGWNHLYKSVNVTGIYNTFLVFGGGLNFNMLMDNEGSRNFALQPLVDIDLVFLTLMLGYNINLNREIDITNKFNFRVQIDILSLIDAIRAKPIP